MKKILILFLVLLLVFTSCSNDNQSIPNSQIISDNIIKNKTTDNVQHNDSLEISSPNVPSKSYVEELAYLKADEIGMFEVDDSQAIRLAYDYLLTNVYFADPIGLDIWRYFSDDPDMPISFIENRSLSPFVFNIGSCEDFAAAMTMLLEAKGLETKYVAGYTLSREQIYIDHAWSMVNLNGDWFHLDPQLEQNIVINGSVRYRFFMKTDDDMITDHKWGENLASYFPDILEDEKENILANYAYPQCNKTYPQQEGSSVILPPKPNYPALYSKIDEIKSTKDLRPIHLNVEPPILVSKYHITPPLINSNSITATKVDYGKSTLSSGQKTLYERIASQLSAYNQVSFTPNKALTREEIMYTIRQVQNDNPTFYWVDANYNDIQNEISLAYNYNYTREQITKELAELKNITNEIIAECSGKSDFEKALFAHNYLAENVRYDAGFKGTDSDNPYGAIVDNVAYCDGYARGFQYLADVLGIENIYVTGWNTKSTTHAWNAVKLENEWYYVDVTWDRSSNSYGGAYHDFFAITSSECFDSRVWDDRQYLELPHTTATKNNFYVNLDYVITKKDAEDINGQRQRIAEIANRQLQQKDNLKNDYSYSFVEFKVLANKEEYDVIKNYITKDLFYILEEMERQAKDKNYNFSVSYNTEVSCYFNDSLQIVAFYPKVKNK